MEALPFTTIDRDSIPKSLYSEGDTRRNIFQLDESVKADSLRLAQGIGCLIEEKFFEKLGPEYVLNQTTLKDRIKDLSDDVSFVKEWSVGLGTAFLVGKNKEGKPLALTAAHCVCDDQGNGRFAVKEELVQKVRLVFEFYRTSETTDYRSISKENVYQIQVFDKSDSSDEDWALLELTAVSTTPKERETPFSFNFIDTARLTLEIFMLGHPLGLPLKHAPGKTIQNRALEIAKIAEAKIPSFQGNSGSPVFNRSTNEVMAMLIWGKTDFEENGEGKKVEAKYDETTTKKFEKIQLISRLPKKVIDLIKPGESKKRKEVDQLWNDAYKKKEDGQLDQVVPLLKEAGSRGLYQAFYMLGELLKSKSPAEASAYFQMVSAKGVSGIIVAENVSLGPDAVFAVEAKDGGKINISGNQLEELAIQKAKAEEGAEIDGSKTTLSFGAQRDLYAGKNGEIKAQNMKQGEGSYAVISANGQADWNGVEKRIAKTDERREAKLEHRRKLREEKK